MSFRGGGGGGADPSRVPQFLNAAEQLAQLVQFTVTANGGVLAVASNGYPNMPLDTRSQITDYCDFTATGIKFFKAGIYAVAAFANVEYNAAGSYRIIELNGVAGPGPGGGHAYPSQFDVPNMSSPDWARDMGALSTAVFGFTVPHGVSTDPNNPDAYMAISLNQDAGVSLNFSGMGCNVTPIAFFEAL